MAHQESIAPCSRRWNEWERTALREIRERLKQELLDQPSFPEVVGDRRLLRFGEQTTECGSTTTPNATQTPHQTSPHLNITQRKNQFVASDGTWIRHAR